MELGNYGLPALPFYRIRQCNHQTLIFNSVTYSFRSELDTWYISASPLGGVEFANKGGTNEKT
jgi:hypothetical protein